MSWHQKKTKCHEGKEKSVIVKKARTIVIRVRLIGTVSAEDSLLLPAASVSLLWIQF